MKKQNGLKPVANLKQIIFRNVKPKAVQRAGFIVKNIGGDINKVKMAPTAPWLNVVRKRYTPTKDELHFELKASGEEEGKTYKDLIDIKINGEEIKIKVILRIRKKRKISAVPSVPTAPRKKKSRWLSVVLSILLCAIVVLTAVLVFSSRPEKDLRVAAEKPPASLNSWIEGSLISQLTSRPNEWYDYWFNDCKKVDDREFWVVGGITFTTADYMFETINFVFYSPDGQNWQIKWRNDQLRETRFFGAKQLKIVSREEVFVSLKGPHAAQWTLYTADKGRSWKIKIK